MIIVIIVLVISLVLFIYNIYHDKLALSYIKLYNIEEKINSTLIKRKELVKDAENKIKEIIKTDKVIFENFKEIDNNNDMFDLNKKLLLSINDFYVIKDKYKKLHNNTDFQKICFSIDETGDLLNSYKKYYDKEALEYNKLIKSLPLFFVSLITRKKEKKLFKD